MFGRGFLNIRITLGNLRFNLLKKFADLIEGMLGLIVLTNNTLVRLENSLVKCAQSVFPNHQSLGEKYTMEYFSKTD